MGARRWLPLPGPGGRGGLHTLPGVPARRVRIRTKAGDKHALYGLNRLSQCAQAGYVVLVEGESDAHTLWHAGYPVLGLPGANGWNEERDAVHLAQMPVIYVVIEPDIGGAAVLRWLGGSAIRERVRLVTLQDAKDVSELYLADTEAFADRLEAALMAATPWGEHERIAARVRSGEAMEGVLDSSRRTSGSWTCSPRIWPGPG